MGEIPEKFRYVKPNPELLAYLAAGKPAPDIDALRSWPYLPDPLAYADPPARTAADWPAQRAAILQAYRTYSMGTWPEPPGNVAAKILSERQESAGAVAREVELSFGPDRRALLHLELLLPPGKGPFPVFMTQRTHVAWTRIALARGCAAVAYDACDGHDDSQTWKPIWPEHDWSMLCRRAWAAGRALDWLHTLDVIDRRHACIAGHSRNGKLSLICGAIDERFDVVISSSSGLGGACPYRLANNAHFTEGIDWTSREYPEWFHPRLHFFVGREDRMPVDANLLLALSAPRAVLFSSALNDVCESVVANEAALRSAFRVFRLLGCEEKLAFLWRWGWHDSRPEDVERFIDWCDLHWGRSGEEPGDVNRPASAASRAGRLFGRRCFFPYRFDRWARRAKVKVDLKDFPPRKPLGKSLPASRGEWESSRSERIARVQWLLGDEPPTASRANHNYGQEQDYIRHLLHRPMGEQAPGLEVSQFNFGEYLTGTVYAPAGAAAGGKRLPVAVWLHPESVACGFSGAYVEGGRMPAPLASAGFVTLAFDQIGNGRRLEEARDFYERYPDWSLLGRMVHDVRRAVDAAVQIPFGDPERVFLVGFGLGATVGIFAAALDERVAGLVAACGFTPMRTDTSDKSSGGVARYALWDGYGLVPRLGFFARPRSHQRRIPIDFDEVLASIAPRPLLVAAPTVDREADPRDVAQALDAVEKVYGIFGQRDRLRRYAPFDHRRWSPELQQTLYADLHQVADEM